MVKSKPLRLGTLLPTRGIIIRGGSPPDIQPVFKLAREAELAGLDSLWVGDSLTAKPRLEPLTTLAALAIHTEHVKLGTAVLLAALRHPVLLAQMAATVDVLSGGRLVLGIGAGGAFTDSQRDEWNAAGVPSQTRGHRITEITEICQQLWNKDGVSFSGRHFNLENVTIQPKPIQENGVPVLLACHAGSGSQAQYLRAGHHAAGIMGITDAPGQFKNVLQEVRQYAAEADRNPDDLSATFYMTVNINNDEVEASTQANEFISRYYGVNIWQDNWGPFGTPEAIGARILEYYEAGAQEIIIRFASFDPLGQFHKFVQEVIPHVAPKRNLT